MEGIPAHSCTFPHIPTHGTFPAGVQHPFKLSLNVLFPSTAVPAWLSTFADEHLAAAAQPGAPHPTWNSAGAAGCAQPFVRRARR